jgi:hypothetical protein
VLAVVARECRSLHAIASLIWGSKLDLPSLSHTPPQPVFRRFLSTRE